jgi:hypothetical protein
LAVIQGNCVSPLCSRVGSRTLLKRSAPSWANGRVARFPFHLREGPLVLAAVAAGTISRSGTTRRRLGGTSRTGPTSGLTRQCPNGARRYIEAAFVALGEAAAALGTP